jgi:FkbM family methyltransferase
MGFSIKKLKQLYLYLLRIQGVTAKDELRLIIAIILYASKLGKGGSLGYFIPGFKPITIRTWDESVFVVRPRTPDLGFATLTLEFYELTRWFLPNARGVVIDVGANIGGYTVRACKYADLVIAIEPQSEVFKLLKKNVEMNCINHNVVLMNKAIGDTKGKALLRIPVAGNVADTGRASLLGINGSQKQYVYEEVSVDTLDNIIKDLNINRVNLLKIDIEGAEALAFKGMRRTLEITDKLMIEIQPGNEWLIRELKEMGFRLVDKKETNYFFIKIT